MKSIKGLIQYLLGEIALCDGATTSDIQDFSKSYYAQEDNGDAERRIKLPVARPNVDRKYAAQVWAWLCRHPDVRVGQDGNVECSTFTEVEAHNERVLASTADSNANEQPGGEQQPQSSSKIPIPQLIKLYASEEQTWQALAGHGPDSRRITPREFSCLSIIASRREKGILQPELVRLSGQDARSVPPRTQRLHDSGYIVKSPVVIGTRTSFLVLKRFSKDVDLQAVQDALDHGRKVKKHKRKGAQPKKPPQPPPEVLRNRSLIQRAMGFVERQSPIVWDTLKNKVKLSKDDALGSFLANALKKIEKEGFVRRVRNPKKKLCIQSIKKPTKAELQSLIEEIVPCDTADYVLPDEGGNTAKQSTDTATSGHAVSDNSDGSSNQAGLGDRKQSCRGEPVLEWDPDRLLVHSMRDVVERQGREGATNSIIQSVVTGPLYRRPLEQQMGRLSDFWQMSQPPHLRHLGIIKDTKQDGRMNVFAYYTPERYQELVDDGEASWDAVKAFPKHIMPEADVDGYGFPELPSSQFQGTDSDATLADCFGTTAKPVGVTKAGRRIMETYEKPSKSNRPPKLPKLPKPPKPKGRPRKYPKEGLPQDAADMTEDQITTILRSQERARRYERNKAEREVGTHINVFTPLNQIGPFYPSSGGSVLSSIGYFPSIYAHSNLAAGCQINQDSQAVRSDDAFVEGMMHTTTSSKKRPSSSDEDQTSLPSKKLKMSKPVSTVEALLLGRSYINTTSRPYIPSMVAHNQLLLLPESLIQALDKMKPAKSNAKPTAALTMKFGLPFKTHQEQLSAISRPSTGVFVGVRSVLKKLKPRGRPPSSRMIVFKSPRLTELPGFVKDPDEFINISKPAEELGPNGLPLLPWDKEAKLRSQNALSAVGNDQIVSRRNSGVSMDQASPFPMTTFTSVNNALPARRPVSVIKENTVFRKDIAQRSTSGDGDELVRSSIGTEPPPKGSKSRKRSLTATTDDSSEQSIPKKWRTSETAAALLQRFAESGQLGMGDKNDSISELHDNEATENSVLASSARLDVDNLTPTPGPAHTDDIAPSLSTTGHDLQATNQEPPMDALPEKQVRRKTRISTSGGTLPFKRGELILSILRKTDGVFPGDLELFYPFATLWRKKYGGAQPDRRTVKKAKEALIKKKQLRSIVFSFKDRHGAMVERRIVTLPEVEDLDDPRIKETERRMAQADPQIYIPEGVDVDPNLRAPQAHFNAKIAPKANDDRSPEMVQDDVPKHSRPVTSFQEHMPSPKPASHPGIVRSQFSTGASSPLDTSSSEPSSKTANHYPYAIKRRGTHAPGSKIPAIYDESSRHSGLAESDTQLQEPIDGQVNIIRKRPTEASDTPARQVRFAEPPDSEPPVNEESPNAKSSPRKRKFIAETGKPRRLTSLLDRLKNKPTTPTAPRPADSSVKRMRFRGPHMGTLGSDKGRHFYLAVLIVRTLLGGVERSIQWDHVEQMLAPEWTMEQIRRSWNRVREFHKAIAEKMQIEFQDMFVQAYEAGTIPHINYNDLESFDWVWLHKWTIEKFDVGCKSNIELPATREELDSMYELKDTVVRGNQIDYYETFTKSTVPRRHYALHRHPWVKPFENQPSKPKDVDVGEVVNTWVRANVITPEDSYNPEAARNKLIKMGEPRINKSIRELLAAKVLVQGNKGRRMPSRTYDISDAYMNRMKGGIDLLHFQQAAAFKNDLDAKLATGERVFVSERCLDGDIVAVINLVSSGQIELIQHDVPKEKFGLMESGYTTRLIDKKKYSFPVEFIPTDSYQYGNPAMPLPEAPRAQPRRNRKGEDVTKIPIWYDINGDLVPLMWDWVRTAVLSTLAIRPGLTVKILEETFKNALANFELKLLLQWFVDAGLGDWVGQDDPSIRLNEWWWLFLYDGKGKGKEVA